MKVICINLKPVRRFLVIIFGLIMYLTSIIAGSAVLFSVLDANAYVNTNASVEEGKVIIIDAGHGGEDSGAIASDGTMEKDLNLSIAMELGTMLNEKGYTVVYTRTSDKMLYSEDENIKGMRKLSDLKNRCKLADQYEDVIFVSIHINSYGSENCSGLQVYYKDKDENSRALAQFIQASTKNNLQPNNNRVIKNGKDIYVLNHCPSDAVLVECGFISNPTEAKKLSEKEYQNQLSFSILCGIIEYIESTNNQ